MDWEPGQRTVKTVKGRRRIVTYEEVDKTIVLAEPPYVLFGEKIRELRKAKGWNQTQLSLHTHLSRPSIVNIELGRQRVLLGDVYVFARALDVDPLELFRATMTE